VKRLGIAAAGVWVFAARRALRFVAARARWSSTLRTRAQALAVAIAAVPAIAGFVLLAAQPLQSLSVGGDSTTPPATLKPVVLYARPLCTFANEDARAALIDGVDGGASVVVGGRAFWLFGDTLFLPESGKRIEQNTIAWSQGQREDGCPKLEYYTRNGIAIPFLPKDGSLTNWPVGGWAVDDRFLDIYVTYIYGTGPFAYWVGEIGVSRLDTKTMKVEMLARVLWNANSGFSDQVIGAQPVEIGQDGMVRVVLQTASDDKLLARVPAGSFHQADAYEFWTGKGWSSSPADAVPLWAHPQRENPAERLVTFENMPHIAFNPYLRKYVAVVNMGIGTIGARTADRLEGPWTDPMPWLDCTAVAQVTVPTCYSPAQHPELAADGGQTLFVTFARQATYDVVAYEVRIGDPFHEYIGGDGTIAYSATPPEGEWKDDGIAFYASAVPLPGFAPVYRWERGSEVAYGADAPEPGFTAGEMAFYAAPTDAVPGSVTTYRPVFEWRNGSVRVLSPLKEGLEEYGYTRGRVVFFAP
jgi:hypothetical protein